MVEIHSKARIRWACRRGMLELDVLFMPFVEEAYDSLSAEQQAILYAQFYIMFIFRFTISHAFLFNTKCTSWLDNVAQSISNSPK